MPAAPRIVTGNVKTLAGLARAGIEVTFVRTGAGDVFGQNDEVVVNEPIKATSGEGGALSVTLYPGSYSILCSGANGPKRATMALTEDGSTDLTDLIGQAAPLLTSAAELARDKAREWATNPEDDPVEPGEFSARHHAIKAAASAGAASTAGATAGAAAGAEAGAAAAQPFADASAASAAAALVSQTTALAAANAAGPTVIYATKALADAALAGLAPNTVIEVSVDESRGGRRSRYRKTGGVYVFELDLMPVVQPYYVNKATGNNGNNGRTRAAAVETIAALPDASLGDVFKMFGNSKWRETLDLGAAQGATVQSEAADPAKIPEVCGADIVTGWTASGTGNVWQKSVSFDSPADGALSDRIRVWKDGVVLTRVANIAACGALPNSFVDARRSAGSPVTIYANVGAGLDANDFEMEVSVRGYAVYSAPGSDVTVKGPLIASKGMGNNGPFTLRGLGDVSKVLALDGTKHNFFLGAGVANECVGSVADLPTSYEGSNTTYVSYMDDPTGYSYKYVGCLAVEVSGTSAAGFSGNVGFLAHGSLTSLFYDVGELVQCGAAGDIMGGHGGGAEVNIETGCHWAGRSFISRSDMVCEVSEMTANIPAVVKSQNTPTNVLTDITMSNCSLYFQERKTRSNTQSAMRHEGGDVDIQNCTFWCGDGVDFNANAFEELVAATGSQNVEYSIIGGNWSGFLLAVADAVTYTGDFNVFLYGNIFNSDNFLARWHSTNYATLAAWQSATGQDANSVVLKTADQVAGSGNSFWLAWAEAPSGTDLDTIGPAVGDFRINPRARVYDSSDVAYVGTFADGVTPITLAGQQRHRDWNLRTSVLGPCRKFPSIPTTEDEQRRYIVGRWTF